MSEWDLFSLLSQYSIFIFLCIGRKKVGKNFGRQKVTKILVGDQNFCRLILMPTILGPTKFNADFFYADFFLTDKVNRYCQIEKKKQLHTFV